MLECKGLRRRFGAVTAVEDLSFSLGESEILGVTGPNGAGKTTLLEVISGFTPANAGTVTLDGRDLTRLSPQAVCRSGICRFFQQNTAFDSMSVFDNVAVAVHFGRAGARRPSRKQVQDEVHDALAVVGLQGRPDAIAGSLSAFERKCLMLASSMVTRPRLLLLDEPVGGLNPEEMDRMAALVTALNRRGVAMILIEHVMRFMFKIAPRILVMHHGSKVFDGPAAAMIADPTVRKLYLGERAAANMERMAQGWQAVTP